MSGMYNNAIFVQTCAKVPAGDHFAILLDSSYTSHAYGEDSSNNYVEYRAYLKREDWEAAIKELETDKGYGRKNFRAIFVRSATITTTVSIEVK
jgi:hypothetical protein